MGIITTAALIFWGILIVAAIAIAYICERPGNRRKGQISTFEGEDRRSEAHDLDFWNQPIFKVSRSRHHKR